MAPNPTQPYPINQRNNRYVRPAALSLVRENRPNVRDAGLSLLRAVEVALESATASGSSSRARRGSGSGGSGVRGSADRSDRREAGKGE